MPLGAQASSSPNLGSSAASAAIRLGISTRSWRSRHRARLVQRIRSGTSEPSAQLTAARVSARKVRLSNCAWRLSRTCAGRFPNALDIAGFQNARLQAGEVIRRTTVALIQGYSFDGRCAFDIWFTSRCARLYSCVVVRLNSYATLLSSRICLSVIAKRCFTSSQSIDSVNLPWMRSALGCMHASPFASK